MLLRTHHKHHAHVQFKKVDPLGDGLRDEIECEQCEAEAIKLEENITEDALTNFWDTVEKDIQKDPEWFNFADEDE